jgi:cyanophycin synthetase
MTSIKQYCAYDGYRLGSERPELVLTLEQDWLSQSSLVDKARWDRLAESLSQPDVFSTPSMNSIENRLIKAYDLICTLFHIPACLTRIIKNHQHEILWVVPYYDANTSYLLCKLLMRYLNKISEENSSNQEQEFFEEIHAIKKRFDSSLNNYFLLKAARDVKVPTLGLETGTWQLGYCKNLRIFRSTVSEKSSSLMLNWVRDKYKTAQLLNRMGYPGAQHRLIRNEVHLKQSIQEMGFPLVIKPRDLEQGRGVSADLKSEADVLLAYAEARKCSEKILLEKHQEGNTHRLTVINGQLIRVVKRIPGGIIGDGVHSVEELTHMRLVDDDNQRRIKRRGYSTLTLDDEAISILKQQSYSPASIPSFNQFVKLRRRDNINAGGTNELVSLDQVHPDNRRLAQDIARDFHLDFIGVDLIIDDITASWQQRGATICELNGQPQLAAFSDPNLYPAILDSQLVNHGQIPIKVFIYFSESEALRLMRYREQSDDLQGYWTQSDGVYYQNNRISVVMNSTYHSAKAALYRKEVDRLSMFLSSEEISRYGLPISASQIQACCVFDHQSHERQSLLTSLGIQKHQVVSL